MNYSPTSDLTLIVCDWLKARNSHHELFDKTVFSPSIRSNISDWIVCSCNPRLLECRINYDSVEIFKEEYRLPSRFIYSADPQFFDKLDDVLKRSCKKQML